MISRLGSHKLALVLVISVVVRLMIFFAFPRVFDFVATGQVQGSDAYDVYARNLLDTGVYGRTAGVADAAIPPFYSVVLAGVYRVFGRGALQVALFHILLDATSIAMLYEIGKRLLPQGETAGALAGLFYALYPYLIFQNLTLIDTPLFMFLLYAYLLMMVLLRQRASPDRVAWALAGLGGLALGLGMLIRPILPPLAVLVAVWFLFRLNWKQTILRHVPVVVVSLALLGVWVARNYTVFGALVPMTTTSGANFWQGNSPYTVPYFRAGYDVQWTSPDHIDASDPNSREADAERFAQALQYLRENPDKIPELLWVKFLVHWSIDIAPRLNPTEGKVPRLDYQGNVIQEGEGNDIALGGLPPGDPVGQYSQPLFDQIGRTVHRFYWGGLLLLGIVGIALTWRAWREVSLLWFVQISMTLVYVFFHPSTRYRVPTDPLLFLFSAYTVIWLWSWWQARRPSIPISVHHEAAG